MKLVFLGDSLTWGQYGGDFVAAVSEQFPNDTIINAGVGGDTVVNLYRRLEDVLSMHQPDALFVMVGGNDAVSYLYPVTRPYYQGSIKNIENGTVDPETFRRTYRELLTDLQLHHVQTFVGLAPTEYNAELVQMKRRYNQIAREVAASMTIPVLDLDRQFSPEQPIKREGVTLDFIREIGQRHSSGWQDYDTERVRWGYRHTFDGMHLMPEAAQQMAASIVEFLREHL